MRPCSIGQRGSCLARRAAAAAAAAGTLFIAPPAQARIQGLTVPVAGMTTVLHSRGVVESIKLLQEVAGVSVDLPSRRVLVEAAEGKSLSIQRIRERVAQAGFKIDGEFDLVALGSFAVGPGRRLTFRIRNAANAYQVLENHETLSLFRAHPELKGEFLVGFRLHEHPGWKRPAIALTRHEPWTAGGSPR